MLGFFHCDLCCCSFSNGFHGWWIEEVADRENYDQFFDWARKKSTQKQWRLALILIEDGRVVRQFYKGGVDKDTLFPTASLSKWITALAVMSLVEKSLVHLDAPISDYLTRWQLPNSEFDNNGVTVRRLLSHTAGLTDGLGFGDYQSDEVLPSTEAELNNPRASNKADVKIIVGREPGGEFLYSGGGYLILQLLVEEVSKVKFADYVTKAILHPLEMHRSTYKFLGDQVNAVQSFDVDGSLAPTYKYASPAATSFSSSASDLSKLVQALLNDKNFPLDSDTVLLMREPHGFLMNSEFGVLERFYMCKSHGDFVFGHDGANEPAINTSVRLNPETSDGFVMLVLATIIGVCIGSEWVLWQPLS